MLSFAKSADQAFEQLSIKSGLGSHGLPLKLGRREFTDTADEKKTFEHLPHCYAIA
jgi:hypothetical protein